MWHGSRFNRTTRQVAVVVRRKHEKNYGGRAGFNRLAAGQSAFNQLFYSYQKSARERGHSFELTANEFRFITQQNCFYCGNPPETKFHAAQGTNGDYIGNGIDRIDNARGYMIGNVRPCCKQCNIAKGVLDEESFMSWVRRVFSRFEHGETPRGR